MWRRAAFYVCRSCVLFLFVIVAGCSGQSVSVQDMTPELERAHSYFEVGQYADAISGYTLVISKSSVPDQIATAYYMRGLCNKSIGEHADAESDLGQAIALAPESWNSESHFPNKISAYFQRCMVDYLMSDFPKAVSDCSVAIDLEPTVLEPYQLYMIRAMSYAKLQEKELASQDYGKVLELSPDPDTEKRARAALSPTGLCPWLSQAQVLRAERFTGFARLSSFYTRYGDAGFSSTDPVVLGELYAAVDEYVPYFERFIEQWKVLGSVPEANEFWVAELEAQEIRLYALEQILLAFDTSNAEALHTGIESFHEATRLGREAEVLLLDLWGVCSN